MSYRLPRPLMAAHELEGFVCASAEQADWLVRHVRQSMATGTTKVFVVTPVASEQVVAYYAWMMAQIDVADAPTRRRKGACRYPQPVALLARLVCTATTKAVGWGQGLVREVAALSEEIDCRGLLVHCASEQVADPSARSPLTAPVGTPMRVRIHARRLLTDLLTTQPDGLVCGCTRWTTIAVKPLLSGISWH